MKREGWSARQHEKQTASQIGAGEGGAATSWQRSWAGPPAALLGEVERVARQRRRGQNRDIVASAASLRRGDGGGRGGVQRGGSRRDGGARTGEASGGRVGAALFFIG
jgi:hypothetical protein